MTAILVIACILLAVLFLASDIKSMMRDTGTAPASPAGPRGWCHTCGKETDGAYYCSEDCYPPEEEGQP